MAGVGAVFLALIFGVLVGVGLAGRQSPGAGRLAGQYRSRGGCCRSCAGGGSAGVDLPLSGTLRQDVPGILVASAAAFAGSRLPGMRLGNPLLGPFFAALVLGLVANLYARRRDPTPQLLLVPGLALLVPGLFGLRSLDSLLLGHSITGVEQGFQMFMMTIALVAGLLFSNTIVTATRCEHLEGKQFRSRGGRVRHPRDSGRTPSGKPALGSDGVEQPGRRSASDIGLKCVSASAATFRSMYSSFGIPQLARLTGSDNA